MFPGNRRTKICKFFANFSPYFSPASCRKFARTSLWAITGLTLLALVRNEPAVLRADFVLAKDPRAALQDPSRSYFTTNRKQAGYCFESTVSENERVLWVFRTMFSLAIPPACYRSLSGPSGTKCPRECPRKWGVSGPWAPECPKSVPRVSPECRDTFLTLWGHFLDTPEPGAQRASGTPRRTLLGHAPFSGTLSGTLRGHFGPEGPERLL